MKSILALFVFLLYSLSVDAQMNNVEFKEYDLDNGLHVILHQDNSTPIVAVTVMYHVGSKNEKPDKTGFAHFFEHLLFEGSENIERGEYFKYVQNAGGTLNANTTYDRTFYYEVVPSNQFELGLWLESERMLHARVDITGVNTQRDVVKEERRLRVDNQPYGSVVEESMKRAYTVHPYKTSVIGSMEHLNAAVEQDYIDFYHDFYVPNNAVLSIAGDIDMMDAEKMIAKYFGEIPKGTKPIYRPNIIEPEMTAEIRDTVYDNIQLPAVIMTYRIPALGTDDFYAVSMLNTLLSQGQSSRMYKTLVDDKQLALYAGSFPFELEDPGAAIVFSIANMGVEMMDLEHAIDGIIDKTSTDLIDEQEFQKLKNQTESDYVRSNARMAGIAESLANYHMYYGETDLINTELNRFLAVSREDIRRVSQKYFNKNNRVVLHYLPKQTNP